MWIIILVVVVIIAGGAYYFLSQDDGTNTNSTNNANAVVNSVSNANSNENTNAKVNENVNTETNTNKIANINTAIDTSDWNTYTDEQSGLSIKYPTDWITVTSDNTTIGFRPEDMTVGDQNFSAVYINIRPNPSGLTLTSFYEQTGIVDNLFDLSLGNEQITKNGVVMTYFETIPGVMANSAVAYKLGAYVVEVQKQKNLLDEIANYQEIFLEIASSVK